jgi:Fuc2NAc and GlcNAc transferase
MVKTALALAAISGCLSLVLTGLVRAYTLRHAVLDRPTERSSHTIPTPRGGGIAILIASGIAGAIAVGMKIAMSKDALTLGAGMLVLGATGWVDDTRGLRARTRLMVHLTVALWTIWMFGGLPTIRLGHVSVPLGLGGYILGSIGIVWSINLFNFMDGIDGLASSQAVLIFGTAAWLLAVQGDSSIGTISMVVAAASFGFLIWNWAPAKIFLGDAGSGALGYLAASIAVASENRGSVPLVAFAILGGVFILDATVTLARRIARGDRPADAHRDHAYQRLARAWGKHWPVSIGAAVVTLGLAALSAAGTLMPSLLMLALLAGYGSLAVLFVAVERRAPM